MNLVIVYLFNEDHLTDVLLAMAEVFENRVIVLDGIAGSEQLASSIPIFSDFSSSAGGGTSFCKVIHTVTSFDDAIVRLESVLKEAGIDFRAEEMGAICVLSLKDAIISEHDL